MFVDLYALNVPSTLKNCFSAVSSNTDDKYFRGWMYDMKTDKQMALTPFAAFTIFRNLVSFRIG